MTTGRMSDLQLSVARPKGWTDRTLYAFTAPRPHPETNHLAMISVSVDQPPARQSFKVYVANAFQLYSADVPGHTLSVDRAGKINGLSAHEFILSWMDGEDYRVRQRLVFLRTGRNEVTAFNAIAADAEFDALAPQFDSVLASLRPQT